MVAGGNQVRNGETANATKWLNRTAQGFYEAELVKAALKKGIFFKFCFVWTAIR
jgi:hypothetical protein